jgi:hypothetical protein
VDYAADNQGVLYFSGVPRLRFAAARQALRCNLLYHSAIAT